MKRRRGFRALLAMCAALGLQLGDAWAQDEGPAGPQPEKKNETPPAPKPEAKLLPQLQRPRIRISCSVADGKGPWSGRLDPGKPETEIYSAHFPKCGYVQNNGGADALQLNVEIKFNPLADVKSCLGVSSGFLAKFEVDHANTKGAVFKWPGAYVTASNLLISNLYGDNFDMEWVGFYFADVPMAERGLLGQHLFQVRASPAFEEYFFGEITLLAGGSDAFSKEVFDQTPLESQVEPDQWDLDVALKVTIFPPKAWCIAVDDAGKAADRPTNLTFGPP